MHVLLFLAMLCGAPCTKMLGPADIARVSKARSNVDSVRVDHSSAAISADSAITWRYDLRTGDHLVYREIFRQEIDGSAVFGLPTKRDKPFGTPFVSAGRYEWSSHLLVLHTDGDRVLVGVQRDRAREDSIATSLDTSSAMSAADRTRLKSRLMGRERYAQANVLDAAGDARLPWAARREMRSKMLWDFFELPSLPRVAVRVGDHWQSTDPFAFEMHVAGVDSAGGESCLRADGSASAAALIPQSSADSSAANALRLSLWYCPSSHLVRRIELEGTYPDVNYYKVHERAELILADRKRGESPNDWLRSADLRQGALAAASLGDSTTIASLLASPEIDSIFASNDSASARLLLALRYRSGAAAPAPATLASLLASENPRVRSLAVRMLARVDAAAAQPMLERAATDSDYFVRNAAARQLHPDSLAHGAAPVCALPDSMRQRLATRRPALAAGTTFRGMASASYLGWPYAIYVPDDYRGDEPFPLIVYLAGNSGPAIEGVQLASPAFERTGYIVVYPNSWGGWWRSATETMVDSLLNEVMRQYAIDPERVYLTGLSNGGTGTLDYASLWPQRWAAAVSAMGAGLFGFTEPGGERPFVSNVTHLPMLFLHGKRDQVIPFDATTKTVDSLRAQHADVTMKLFPEREHELVPGSGDDGATVDFFQHHRGRTLPKKLDFNAATTVHARNYWVEILEKQEVPAGDVGKSNTSIADALRAQLGTLVRAEVRASIDDHDTIHLDAEHVAKLRLLLRPDLFRQTQKIKVVLNGKTVFEGPLASDCALYSRMLGDSGDPWLAYSSAMTFDVPR